MINPGLREPGHTLKTGLREPVTQYREPETFKSVPRNSKKNRRKFRRFNHSKPVIFVRKMYWNKITTIAIYSKGKITLNEHSKTTKTHKIDKHDDEQWTTVFIVDLAAQSDIIWLQIYTIRTGNRKHTWKWWGIEERTEKNGRFWWMCSSMNSKREEEWEGRWRWIVKSEKETGTPRMIFKNKVFLLYLFFYIFLLPFYLMKNSQKNMKIKLK